MNYHDLHKIIRDAFLEEYGATRAYVSQDPASRFAAGADLAAQRIVAELAARASHDDLDPAYDAAGNPRAFLAGGGEPDAGTARHHEPEPAGDPLPWPDRLDTISEQGRLDRERITSLASDTARHEADLEHLAARSTETRNRTHEHAQQITSIASETARIAAHQDEHHQRLDNIEGNLSEATRTIAQHTQRLSLVEQFGQNQAAHADTLREIEARHAALVHTVRNLQEHATATTQHRRPTEAPADDDQRLGGHDNPHPQHPEDA